MYIFKDNYIIADIPLIFKQIIPVTRLANVDNKTESLPQEIL